MKSLILVCLFSMFFMFGCSNGTSPAKVITADLLSSAMSSAVVVSLDCEMKDLVSTDVKTEVYKWFKLDQQRAEKGIVGDLCKTAIKDIVPMLLGTTMNVVKPEWKCKLTKLDNAADILSDLACKNIKI